LGKAIELATVVTVMQNQKQQGVAQNCIGLQDEINKKIFSNGCDGWPNHTSLCDGTASV
jgi:hypothetical protein